MWKVFIDTSTCNITSIHKFLAHYKDQICIFSDVESKPKCNVVIQVNNYDPITITSLELDKSSSLAVQYYYFQTLDHIDDLNQPKFGSGTRYSEIWTHENRRVSYRATNNNSKDPTTTTATTIAHVPETTRVEDTGPGAEQCLNPMHVCYIDHKAVIAPDSSGCRRGLGNGGILSAGAPLAWKMRLYHYHHHNNQNVTGGDAIITESHKYAVVFNLNDAVQMIVDHDIVPILCQPRKKHVASWRPNDPSILRIDTETTSPLEAWQMIKQWIGRWQWQQTRAMRNELRQRLQAEESLEYTIASVLVTRYRRESELNDAFLGGKYCINLDRSPNRWMAVQQELSKHGLRGVERVSAVDGYTTSVHNLEMEGIVKLPHHEPKPGAFGCLASHARLWRRIILESESKNNESKNESKNKNQSPPQLSLASSDNKWFLILEDDVSFHPNFVHLFPQYWEDLVTYHQEQQHAVDWVFLGCTSPAISVESGEHNEKSLLDYATPIGPRLVKNHSTVQGSFAYAITLQGARNLCRKYLPCDRAIDYLPADLISIVSFRRPNQIVSLVVAEALFVKNNNNCDAKSSMAAELEKKSGGHKKAEVVIYSPDTPKLFYTIFSVWEGRHFINLHGLVSVNENESTVVHSTKNFQQQHQQQQQHPWPAYVINLRNHGFWEQAYNHLKSMMRASFVLNATDRQFVCFDELFLCCVNTNRIREAQWAARKLVSVNRATVQGRKMLMCNKDRLLSNVNCFGDKELISIYQEFFDAQNSLSYV